MAHLKNFKHVVISFDRPVKKKSKSFKEIPVFTSFFLLTKPSEEHKK